MRASIAVSAVLAGAASAAFIPNGPSTVISTDVVTITSCGAEVTNCPARTESSAWSVPTEVPAESSGEAGPILSSISVTTSIPSEYTSIPSEVPSSPVSPVASSVPSVPESPEESSTPAAPSSPASSPASPVEASSESVCATVTETVYLPSPTGGSSGAPYPTTAPAGTGSYTPVVPSSVWGTGSGSPIKPTTSSAPASPEFTGAASHMNAGMAVAGLGAFAAMLL